MDLYFADTAGNVFLHGEGLHLYVTGRRRTAEFEAGEEGRITNPAGLKLVFTLLCKADLLNGTYREIAAAARVALGTVGPVMKELETRGHFAPLPEGARAAQISGCSTTGPGMGGGLSEDPASEARDVEILDIFWNTVPAVDDLVPPLLAYADLTGTTDGRNLEAAKMIYEQLIEPALRNQP